MKYGILKLVIKMKVYVYIDPEYNGSVWCSQTLKGLSSEAAKRHYGVYFLENEDILSVNLDKVYGEEERRVLIVLTTRVITDGRFYDHFAKNGVSLLFVNHQSSLSADNYSNVLVDYRKGMAQVIKYLSALGKHSTALFAINPASSTDQIKKEYFLSVALKSEDDIIYNNGSLDECCEKFGKGEKYDSVICANDVAAYCLMNYLRKKGISIPGDIYVVSFGDSLLSQLGSPSLTTISVDHTRLGRQALHAYSYLYKRSNGIRTSVYVTPVLNVRESTDNRKVSLKERVTVGTTVNDPMYSDATAKRILNLETMLASCDENDFKILKSINEGKTYSTISEELFMSEKTVSYRVSCMRSILGCSTKEELCEIVSEHINL